MKTSQLHIYKNNYKLREHQKKLLQILKKKFNRKFNGTILDAGCAQGVFLMHFKKQFPDSKVVGIDTSAELISKSRKLNIPHSKFYKRDFLKIMGKYDLVFASGVLGYYDNFINPLNKLISLTKKGGKLFIFSHFNSLNIDTLIRFRNNFNSNKWERGLNSFSLFTIRKFLKKKKTNFKILKFDIPINLRKRENPIISYTINTLKNKKMILSGSNLRLEYFYLIVNK